MDSLTRNILEACRAQLIAENLAQYDAAAILRQVEEERAQAGGEGETFQDMPRKKRILVQTVSVLAFLLVVMLVVFGADAAANWLKSLF